MAARSKPHTFTLQREKKHVAPLGNGITIDDDSLLMILFWAVLMQWKVWQNHTVCVRCIRRCMGLWESKTKFKRFPKQNWMTKAQETKDANARKRGKQNEINRCYVAYCIRQRVVISNANHTDLCNSMIEWMSEWEWCCIKITDAAKQNEKQCNHRPKSLCARLDAEIRNIFTYKFIFVPYKDVVCLVIEHFI